MSSHATLVNLEPYFCQTSRPPKQDSDPALGFSRAPLYNHLSTVLAIAYSLYTLICFSLQWPSRPQDAVTLLRNACSLGKEGLDACALCDTAALLWAVSLWKELTLMAFADHRSAWFCLLCYAQNLCLAPYLTRTFSSNQLKDRFWSFNFLNPTWGAKNILDCTTLSYPLNTN